MVFCALSLVSFLAGSFQLIIMMFEEYILLIIENQLITQLDEDLKLGLRRHLKGIFRLTGNLRHRNICLKSNIFEKCSVSFRLKRNNQC